MRSGGIIRLKVQPPLWYSWNCCNTEGLVWRCWYVLQPAPAAGCSKAGWGTPKQKENKTYTKGGQIQIVRDHWIMEQHWCWECVQPWLKGVHCRSHLLMSAADCRELSAAKTDRYTVGIYYCKRVLKITLVILSERHTLNFFCDLKGHNKIFQSYWKFEVF